KIRTGDPVDDDEDIGLPVWAGVLPLVSRWDEPVDAADLPPGIFPSSAVGELRRSGERHRVEPD
ncbi:MAG: hypothetical protein ACXW2C_10640, partial [Acidimicrobiia bacterium]